MSQSTRDNRRILVVDDTPAIHRDFQSILGAGSNGNTALNEVDATLFGQTSAHRPGLELDSAYQGEEALAKVVAALDANRPYALAFIDMRMPPGWDDLETIEHRQHSCATVGCHPETRRLECARRGQSHGRA